MCTLVSDSNYCANNVLDRSCELFNYFVRYKSSRGGCYRLPGTSPTRLNRFFAVTPNYGRFCLVEFPRFVNMHTGAIISIVIMTITVIIIITIIKSLADNWFHVPSPYCIVCSRKSAKYLIVHYIWLSTLFVGSIVQLSIIGLPPRYSKSSSLQRHPKCLHLLWTRIGIEGVAQAINLRLKIQRNIGPPIISRWVETSPWRVEWVRPLDSVQNLSSTTTTDHWI